MKYMFSKVNRTILLLMAIIALIAPLDVSAALGDPEPTPTVSPVPTPSASPLPSVSPTPLPSISPTPMPTASPAPTVSPVAATQPTPSPTPSPAPVVRAAAAAFTLPGIAPEDRQAAIEVVPSPSPTPFLSQRSAAFLAAQAKAQSQSLTAASQTYRAFAGKMLKWCLGGSFAIGLIALGWSFISRRQQQTA